MAILRGEAVDTYFLDVYPYASDGRSLGLLAASLDVTRAGDGSLSRGVLRLLPRCAGGLTLHCTSVVGAAALGLVPPVGAGAPRPAAALEVSTTGAAQADFSWTGLLAGTTWAPSPAPALLPVGRGPAELACDLGRLRGFLDRLAVAAPASAKPVAVNLTFTGSGDFTGLAYTGNGPTPERHLAFSTNPEEMTLLRNPARLQLGSVSATRNALASDLVPAGDADRLSITINPTLSPSPVPSSLLVLDNVAPPAGSAASARPGRGIEPLLARCHAGLGERDAYLLQLLARLVRVEVAGAATVKTAIFGGNGSFSLRIYPFGPGGAPMGRLVAGVGVNFDPVTGELVTGSMRFAGRCPEESCTDFQGSAALDLVRPAGAGVIRDPSPYRLSTDDLQETVFIRFADLLGATSWRAPLPATGRGVGERIALGGSVLWVGAHPDDESLAAPLLGEVCAVRGARCTFLVATRGERGDCHLPGGCLPDLATVRTAEMQNAAGLFGAHLIQWDLPDGAGTNANAVRQAWAATQPHGSNDLRDRLLGIIAAAHPTAIVTFDPRHGSTCHPDHMAVSNLVGDLLRETGAPPIDLYWIETRLAANGDLSAGFFPAIPGDPVVRTQNAAPFWSFLLNDAAAHPSQITPADVAALGAAPASGRIVPVLLTRDLIRDDELRYERLCE